MSSALAMTYAGAHRDTAKQMAETLHFPPEDASVHAEFGRLSADLNKAGNKGDFKLTVANSLWARENKPFRKEFIALLRRDYGATVTQLDFAAEPEKSRQTINNWVEDRTQDKIKDLIGPGLINSGTSLVLANAIYFKGDWAARFKKDLTKDEPFHLDENRTTPVPLMAQTGEFLFAQDEKTQALELPYAGGRLSMVVLLPKLGGLDELEKGLLEPELAAWLGRLKKSKVEVHLPRFKSTSAFRLDDALLALGMSDAFSSAADFSGMDGERDLFISAVLHKAFVDVNEEGSEAAAATAVVMLKSVALEPAIPVFRADRPFVFLIRDSRTGSILFVGRFADPRD
jgi:serpin B